MMYRLLGGTYVKRMFLKVGAYFDQASRHCCCTILHNLPHVEHLNVVPRAFHHASEICISKNVTLSVTYVALD